MPNFGQTVSGWINNVLEMSSSWNFSARASPSYEAYEGSKPSQAKLVQFNFQAETKLK